MGFCGSMPNAMSVKNGVLHNTCFVDVLTIIPDIVLVLFCVFILTVWNHSVIGKIKVTTWVHFQGHTVRWIFTLTLIILNIVQIAEGVISDSHNTDTVNYHTFVPQCTATVATVVSIVYYHNVEMWNSPKFLLVLMIYWPMAIVLKTLKAFSLYKNHLTTEYLQPWLLWMAICVYLILFFIELNLLRIQRYSFFKHARLLKPPPDLEHAKFIHSYVNFLSKAVYWWITDLMVDGYKSPIQQERLGELPKSEKTATQYKKLLTAFEKEKFEASQQKRDPSLTKSYLKAFWKMLFLGSLFRLLSDLCSFVGPVCIEYIIDYAYDVSSMEFPVNNNASSNKLYEYVTFSEFVWNGYILSVIVFFSSILQHTFLHSQHFILVREGIRLRSGIQVTFRLSNVTYEYRHRYAGKDLTLPHRVTLSEQGLHVIFETCLELPIIVSSGCSLVYDKALKLSTVLISSDHMTIGQIMNHMTVDSMFLMHLFFFIQYVWAIPLMVLVGLFLLYLKLGVSAVIGGMVVVLSAPITLAIGYMLSKLQKKVMIFSDKRVKQMNELVHGIKVIKLLAWEDIFISSIEKTRSQEIKYLFPNLCLRGLIGFVGMAAPTIGAIITFNLYSHLEDRPLTAGRALSTLALFNLLSMPLSLLIVFSSAVANAMVSSKRLLPYLTAPEVIDPQSVGRHTQSIGVETSENEMIKLDFGASGDGIGDDIPLMKLQTNNSCAGSMSSVISHTPCHSRQNSGASLEILDNKRLSLTQNTSFDFLDVKPNLMIRKSSAPLIGSVDSDQYMRIRHHSTATSTEDEDDVAQEVTLIELRTVVEIKKGSFSWDTQTKEPIFNDVDLKITAGKLVLVVGAVGSGKSSLLAAMLGEMVTVSGCVEWSRNMKIALVSQRPWLMHASIRNNILFGKKFSFKRYRKVLAMCALLQDLEVLPSGDLTEIGEKGINLSGGQKQRVAIARAMYSGADTVLLDDPFSALDAHVANHVFDEAILKHLLHKKKTVILVTHQLHYLSQANDVVVMKDCKVHYHGKLNQLKKYDQELYDSWRKAVKDVKAHEIRCKDGDVEYTRSPSLTGEINVERERPPSVQSNLSLTGYGHRTVSQMSVMTEASNEDLASNDDTLVHTSSVSNKKSTPEKGKLIEEEHRETGAVALSTYFSYFRSCTLPLCLATILLYIVYQGLLVTSNVWLSLWSSDSSAFERNMTRLRWNNSSQFDNTPYVMMYSSLAVGAIVVSLIATMVLYYTGLRGSTHMFKSMLHRILKVSPRFFEKNPSGRILNRFSADVISVDQRIFPNFEAVIVCSLNAISAIVVNGVTTPYFLFAAIPLICVYYCLQRFYRSSSRELQRLDSVTKSSIFSLFSETLNGLQTIRAFRVQTEFKRRLFGAIDKNVSPFLFLNTTNRWLGIRLDYMGSLLVFFAAVCSLSAGALGHTNPAFIGLCIMYALMISHQLNFIVRTSVEAELNMNAVERIQEYITLPAEENISHKGKVLVDGKWPEHGNIEFKNVSLTYDAELEPVLNHATFTIKGGEKIGLCGRTGSGKSSLALSLFRMLEVMGGEIYIDNVNIHRVDLSTLRSRLAIIPQDPFLFSGSVRYNLDPVSELKDDKLWAALEVVQMKEVIEGLEGELDFSVSEGGDNFSVGQRQLLCLARAFLKNSKIIILDEATACIDMATDLKLQQVVMDTAFTNKTILTIAHRVTSILNYDRILVLDYGNIIEFDSPKTLLETPTSSFAALVKEARK